MPIKSIIAPLRGDGKGESVLGLALAIGRIFDSHIDVLHVHARPEDMIPFGVPVSRAFKKTITDAAGNLALQEEQRIRALFDDYCKAQGVAVVPADAVGYPVDRLSISWHEEVGKQAAVILRLGRYSDLIVVARPDRDGALGMNTLQSALFDVRKLTAVAPPKPVEETGRHIAIAWNGSTEAARAVSWVLPLLSKADAVSILIAPDDGDRDAGSDRIARYLRLHGIETETFMFKAGRRDIGGPLLEAAAKRGADMIVMGGFGSEKRRELVLGGVTQYVIEHSELPLVMAH